MLRSGLKATLLPFPPLMAAAEGASDWLRWRLRRPPYPKGEALRLNLGCGNVDHPGFVNIDARPARHVHHVQRIDRLRQFADDSVELIYVSHCLEHFSHRQLTRVLGEWRRVLKPGGTVRLSVPDFDLMVDVYQQSDRDMQSIVPMLMGGQDYAFNFHYSCFNFAELGRLLLEAGFRSPKRWQPGQDHFTSVADWSGRSVTYRGKRFPISLNVEAVK